MKNQVRSETISFAVTKALRDLVKEKATQLDMTPSTFSYKIFLDFFQDELYERKGENNDRY